MKDLYNDYPEVYSDQVVTKLNNEYKKASAQSFLQKILKEQNMQNIKAFQEEENVITPTPPTNPNTIIPTQPSVENREYFRLYSITSSTYCNLINLFENIINKTSSSKREIYQEINANLKVDSNTFNDTFYTVCNFNRCNFCNYNQLIYTTMEEFINLTDSLTRLTLLNLPETEANIVTRLRNNSFNLFRTFINARPIRY